jgi:hypothetical protein
MWTVFATVTTGVIVLVAGRILQTFTLDPVNEEILSKGVDRVAGA